MKTVVAALLLLFAALVGLWGPWRHHIYTPDGIVYARFAARDGGMSQRDATLAARRYYAHTPMVRNPRYRALVNLPVATAFARSQVFANRVLYPWLVGVMLRAGAGFSALFIVSLIAYVLFAPALFWLLSAVFPSWAAALISAGIVLLPPVRTIAASDLTDMLALALLTLCFAAMLHLVTRRPAWLLAVFALLATAFALTRPTPYLVILPALAVWAAAGRRGFAVFCGALAAGVAYLADARAVGAFGLRRQLEWVYRHQPGGAHLAFAAWYRSSLVAASHAAAAQAVHTVLPIAAVLCALIALAARRTRAAGALVLGAAVAAAISVPLNPVASSLERVVWLPFIPASALAVCAGISAARAVSKRELALPTGAEAETAA